LTQSSQTAGAGAAPASNPLFTLLELSRRVRQAGTPAELRFLLVNDSHALAAYRQAGFWLADGGLQALSGVVHPDANAPYAQWLSRVCAELSRSQTQPASVTAADLPQELAAEWSEWLPACALWLPLAQSVPTAAPVRQEPPSRDPGREGTASTGSAGGLLLARELPFGPQETALLAEWIDVWAHAWRLQQRPMTWSVRNWHSRLTRTFRPDPGKPIWQQARMRWAAAILVLACLPVRLTVLAPGELVPSHPVVIRAPLDGVVDTFHVQPNRIVKKDQPLFGFDEALISSKLEVAEQSLATAETEYRQTTQQALVDPKYRTQLALLTGKIEERRAEADFLRGQLQRARVLAPQDGVALFDDPSEWIGKPVSVGERIMRIAAADDSEVEAWLPLADAIALEPGAEVKLYLNASPMSPVSARVRYMAHDAVQRPDGSYAYRVRASLDEPTRHRVGLKGTAKLHGGWVPLSYWVMRRPIAALRSTLGF
jgi:hypothetical protein